MNETLTLGPDPGMPDSETWLLPQRAYLLSMREQALPARRAAIRDSRAALAAVGRDDELTRQVALLQLIGDCLQPVEDVGVLATAIMEGIPGLPFYVRATVHDMKAINRFFDEVGGQEDDYFLKLAALRFENIDIYRLFSFRPALQREDHHAIAAAYKSTAGLLRSHLAALAEAFKRLYGYFMAFKHGALVANPELVWLTENRTERIAGMGVWAGREDRVDFSGFHSDHLKMEHHISGVGRLAIELLEYLVDTRMQIFDYVEIGDDGAVRQLPLNGIPWQFWMRPTEVGADNLARLERLGVELLDVPGSDQLDPVAGTRYADS